MYKILIGNYKVQDGVLIKTKDVIDHYDILWNSKPTELYTLSIVDEGDITPTVSNHKEQLHLLLMNISPDRFDDIQSFVPIVPYDFKRPHRFRINLFWQSRAFQEPPRELLRYFHLPSFLEYYRRINRGADLLLEDTVHFQVQNLEIEYAPSPPRRKKMYPSFNERYDLDKLSEEDIRLIGECYGISPKKNIKDILRGIEATLNHNFVN